MKKFLITLFCVSSFAYAEPYNPTEAQMLSLSCALCHNTDGKSVGITPNIAGMNKTYLYKTLLDYKSGKRKGTVMQRNVKGFTDKQLEQIAYYFSQIKTDK